MKEKIKLKQGVNKFYCSLCPGNPVLLKKNILRHKRALSIKNSIALEKDVKGHEELIPKIVREMIKNKSIYSKKTLDNQNQAHIAYLRLIIFCQSQKFTIQKTSGLAKFLKELSMEKGEPLILGASERDEISLIARSLIPKRIYRFSRIKRIKIENRTLGIKYLGYSSIAASMLQIPKKSCLI